MIRYINKEGKVLALLKTKHKVYMGIGVDQPTAYEQLVKSITEDKFAAFDFSLPTSAHNSSVRTRV